MGIIISIENSFEERIVMHDKKIKTSKKDEFRHGIGLENIKQIVEKNKGIVNIKINDEEKRFTLSIYLPFLNVN